MAQTELPKEEQSNPASKQEDGKRFAKRGKFRRGGQRGAGRGRGPQTPGYNDPRWYGTDEIVKLAANYSFFKALGLPIGKLTATNNQARTANCVPGILAIKIMSALPISPNSTDRAVDPINIAAKQQYAIIRKSNSGAKNYEWQDLIIYEMARSSLNELFAFLVRAYGVANTYSITNRYLPRALLTEMGFNADDFISNLASIRLYINNLALRINTLALPHSLTYFERKAWLYTGIYTDSSSSKAQIYFLMPARDYANHGAAFLKYDATSSSNGGCLCPVGLFSFGGGFANWKTVADSLVDAMLTDDDCAIISGDVLKAYGESQLFTCNPIPEDFQVLPVYNEEVLSQFENLIVAPNIYPQPMSQEKDEAVLVGRGYILQDENHNLFFKPRFSSGSDSVSVSQSMIIKPMINFHHTDVTPDQVMVGTRLTATFKDGGVDTGNSVRFLQVASCGTELVTEVDIVRDPSAVYSTRVKSGNVFTDITSAVGVINAIIDLSNFDWAPKLYINDNVNTAEYLPVGDLDTYRVLEEEELAKLHDTATIYMFGVPLIASYAGK